MQVVSDDARAQGRFRARRAWGKTAWEQERETGKGRAKRQSVPDERPCSRQSGRPSPNEQCPRCAPILPGLPRDEPTAERSVAPTAGDSPFLAGGDSLLSGRSSIAPRPRGARGRSIVRNVDAKSLVDVVVDFYVKATGKDGVQMRQQLANMNPAAVQQCRERWQKRAEEVQRFQDKKEEARALFRRQGGLKDDFEREFKHRVMRSLDRNSKEDEKSLEKWTNELRAKAEAEEIKKMKQEDVRSRKALQQCENLSYRLKVNEVMRSLDRNSKEDEKSLEKWTNELGAKAEAEEIKKMKQEDVRSRKALQQCQNLSYRLKVNESADWAICEFASWFPGGTIFQKIITVTGLLFWN